MKSAILAMALLAGSACGAWAQGVVSTPPDLIKTCEGCHGPGGNGTTPSTPRLNGQTADYIVNRLHELADLTRNSVHATMAMYDIAHMKDSLKAAVADYFSHQPPTPAQPQTGKLASIGANLYTNGDSAAQIPACQSCHGAHGEGMGLAPRLAGQHRDYLKAQLWDFNFVMRENAVMHPNAMKLSADQIDALTAYLGTD